MTAMATKLNILSLHRMGPPWRRREAVRELEYMMPTHAPQHRCLVHDADLPLPDYIKRIPFHGIILGPTFLCARYAPKLFAATLADYDWIKDSPAVKIALPQDDYDCSAILDRWVMDWKIDLLVTVCPTHWEALYPNYHRTGRIELGYTGYVSDRWINDWASPKPHEARPIDVSYRASKLPANFGAVGNLKSSIGERFVRATAGTPLKLDISTDPKDLIPGTAWHAFLENSKFCLATPSGSSLLDPEGEFRRRVERYTATHPSAEFAEIAKQTFNGEDGKYTLTAISPRNLEAALAGTVQIATPGSYSDLIEPMQHYIPLAEDCSNISEVVATMQDKPRVKEIAARCKQRVLDTAELRFAHRVETLAQFIATEATKKAVPPTTGADIDKKFRRHAAEMQRVADRHWAFQRVRHWFRSAAIRLGARRVKRLLVATRAPRA